MRVIVTRPAREAAQWVAELSLGGFEAHALPLIAIEPVADAQPLRQAWKGLGGYAALMFVSGNAVHHFFEANQPPAPMGWGDSAIKTRAWAPGPGTREALLAAGVPPGQVDAPAADAAQFDSEALWRVVAPQVKAGDRVLVVRGGDGQGQGAGRDWLAAQLAAAGAQVETVVAYLRRSPQLSQPQLALARRAAADGSAWLFSSSEAIGHLRALLPAQDWAQARAVATHPRIAQAARDAGFGVVCESRPALAAVVAALESIG